jgi:uncharacterized OB-fold protein
MPKGTCPKCGAIYYGWALLNPEYQYCDKCGTKLNIEREVNDDRGTKRETD